MTAHLLPIKHKLFSILHAHLQSVSHRREHIFMSSIHRCTACLPLLPQLHLRNHQSNISTHMEEHHVLIYRTMQIHSSGVNVTNYTVQCMIVHMYYKTAKLSVICVKQHVWYPSSQFLLSHPPCAQDKTLVSKLVATFMYTGLSNATGVSWLQSCNIDYLIVSVVGCQDGHQAQRTCCSRRVSIARFWTRPLLAATLFRVWRRTAEGIRGVGFASAIDQIYTGPKSRVSFTKSAWLFTNSRQCAEKGRGWLTSSGHCRKPMPHVE